MSGMNATLARWLMALATGSMGDHRRDWVCAMQAEFEVAIDDGHPLSFAAGCLVAAWRELLHHSASRFALASHALALLLILPMAALLLSGAILGFPYLASAHPGPFGLAVDGASSLLLNDGNVAVAPSLTLLVLMLAAVDCRAAWLLLDRNWAGAAALTRLHAAATVTLAIVAAMLSLDVTRLLLPVICLVTQLLTIPALSRWHAQLRGGQTSEAPA
ncbi:hypothetical protein [Sphingomonas sp. 1P08PE]|uniref:hypothetical protein n=1 Tax=Sphingomonas sp. 1P08PE TaxID=554122 RepID=UPI0039A2F707